MEFNFITICDATSATAKFLFISFSIEEALGYSPEELLGKAASTFTHPEERKALGLIHSNNVKEDRMSYVVSYRAKHKLGHYVLIDVVTHFCYNVLICTNFALISPDSVGHKTRESSADESYTIQPDGSIRLKRNWSYSQEAEKTISSKENPWSVKTNFAAKREPRFCLCLDKYSEQSNILFASEMCKDLVGLSPIDSIHNSLYDYIAPKDVENVKNQVQMTKSEGLISRLKFKWSPKNNGDEDTLIPVEAVISCTHDGLVLVARLQSPAKTTP